MQTARLGICERCILAFMRILHEQSRCNNSCACWLASPKEPLMADISRLALLTVAVGMPVTQPPPHRSRRAARPHRAPASGQRAGTQRCLPYAAERL
jgi:hypothetical protein